MHLYFICCYTGLYHNNVIKVLNNLKSFSNITFYIINQTNKPVKEFTNFNEILTSKIGVSAARNIGYNLAIREKKDCLNLIYFWDEDIYISKDIIYSISNTYLSHDIDAILFQIKSYSGNKIGNKLFTSNLCIYFNKYRLGNPSFFFNLNRIFVKFNENIGPGKSPIIAAEDTLFIVENKFCNFVLIKDKFLLHPEASEINSPDKIVKYSIAQGAICRKMNFFDKLFFAIIVLHRPILGYLLNFNKQHFYKSRIKAFVYGYKESFNF